jgi:hypothetical protein
MDKVSQRENYKGKFGDKRAWFLSPMFTSAKWIDDQLLKNAGKN